MQQVAQRLRVELRSPHATTTKLLLLPLLLLLLCNRNDAGGGDFGVHLDSSVGLLLRPLEWMWGPRIGVVKSRLRAEIFPTLTLEVECRPGIGSPESWRHPQMKKQIMAGVTYTPASHIPIAFPPNVGLWLCQFSECGHNQRSSKEEVPAAWKSAGLVQKIIFGCRKEVWHAI